MEACNAQIIGLLVIALRPFPPAAGHREKPVRKRTRMRCRSGGVCRRPRVARRHALVPTSVRGVVGLPMWTPPHVHDTCTQPHTAPLHQIVLRTQLPGLILWDVAQRRIRMSNGVHPNPGPSPPPRPGLLLRRGCRQDTRRQYPGWGGAVECVCSPLSERGVGLLLRRGTH